MVVEVINLLHPFIGFAKTFSQDKSHNMFAFMLHPRFNGMDYNSRDQIATLVQ
jgi:hypothetical protein